MIQVRNLNGLQSSRQLFMRGAAGVNIMGQFVNVTAGGDATLTAGVRERGRERERERESESDSFVLYTPPYVSNPCGAMEARWTSNSKVVGSSPIRGGTVFFFSFSLYIPTYPDRD